MAEKAPFFFFFGRGGASPCWGLPAGDMGCEGRAKTVTLCGEQALHCGGKEPEAASPLSHCLHHRVAAGEPAAPRLATNPATKWRPDAGGRRGEPGRGPAVRAVPRAARRRGRAWGGAAVPAPRAFLEKSLPRSAAVSLSRLPQRGSPELTPRCERAGQGRRPGECCGRAAPRPREGEGGLVGVSQLRSPFLIPVRGPGCGIRAPPVWQHRARAEVSCLVGTRGFKLGNGEGLAPTAASSSAPRRVGGTWAIRSRGECRGTRVLR